MPLAPLNCHAVFGDDLFIPVAAVLDNSLLGFVVNIDNSEAFGVSMCPLKVVHQRPNEVTFERHPILDGFVGAQKMLAQVTEPTLVVDFAVGCNLVFKCGTCL